VWIEVIDNVVSEGDSSDTGKVRFKRQSPDMSQPLVIKVGTSGKATKDADYRFGNGPVTTTVTIPGGATEVDLVINPVQDDIEEGDEDIIVTIGNDPAYSIIPTKKQGKLTLK